MDDIVGVREAARQLNIAASTISRQVRDGKIPNRGTNGSPKVSLAEAKKARVENLDPAPRGPSAGSYSANRAEYEAARAALAQLDLAEKLGLTLARGDVEDAIANAARELRDALIRRWRILAVEFQGLSAREIEERGIASDESVLSELAVKLEVDADAPASVAA